MKTKFNSKGKDYRRKFKDAVYTYERLGHSFEWSCAKELYRELERRNFAYSEGLSGWFTVRARGK